ncbi:MAG: hypothetical protein QQN41_10335 [Nitrosopumilus sp.]
MTPDVWENVMNILIEKYELSKTELYEKSWYANKTKFWKYLEEWEKESKISVKEVGKEKLVSLSSSDKGLEVFIKNFGIELVVYEKRIKSNLQQLKNNLPLLHKKMPMKRVKTRIGVLELDKKQGVYRDMGKTEESHDMTWNCRKKPLMHFENIMSILNTMYQHSSALNYNIGLDIDTSLMKKYQKKSDKMINETVHEIEDMFRGQPDFHYAITRLRASISGIIYQLTMKSKIDTARNP